MRNLSSTGAAFLAILVPCALWAAEPSIEGPSLSGQEAIQKVIGNTLIAVDQVSGSPKPEPESQDLLYFAPDGTGRLKSKETAERPDSVTWHIDDQDHLCLVKDAETSCAQITIRANNVALQYADHTETMKVTLVTGNPFGL